MTSSVMLPFDSHGAISYRHPIVTKSLSPAVFRDNVHQTYWGHDLDLSGSRDVIGHVTIGLGMCHFLLVVLWTQVSICNGFRDILPQTSCAHRHNAKSSLRMRASRDMYPLCKFKYIFQFLAPTLFIHYATFIGLR